MVVPLGTTVTLDISADDVMHSFWVPAVGGKMDAVPGYINKMWFQANKPGTYTGQCAELCGRNHANMFGRVIGLRYDDWKRWYDAEARSIKQAKVAAAAQRKQLIAQEGRQAASQGGAGMNADTGQHP